MAREINKIHNECCLETMANMPENLVNLVITSPPYNMNLRIKYGKYLKRENKVRHQDKTAAISAKYSGTFQDDMDIDEYNTFHSGVLTELMRVSAGPVFYNIAIVTGSKLSVFKMIGEFSDYLKDIIVWDKGHGQPAMQEGVLNRRTELILVFDKYNAISRQFDYSGYFDRGTLDDLWRINRPNDKVASHGAVFPEELVRKALSNFSGEGHVVYDPFMGTGTTAVVARKMGRRFIGSEINKDYIDVAMERLKSANDLFHQPKEGEYHE